MRANPFADRSPTPAEHFRLSFFSAVLRLFEHLERVGPGTAEDQFPFLAGYRAELAAFDLDRVPAREAVALWTGALGAWERGTSAHLPLRVVREAGGLCPGAEAILLTAGLIEEDPRFGLVFEEAQGTPGQHRPTLGLLSVWWHEEGGARPHVRALLDLGLLQVANPDALRLQWAVQVNPVMWDAVRGEVPEVPIVGTRYRRAHELPELSSLVLPDATRTAISRLPDILKSGAARTVLVRGPRGNGRRAVLGALARALGRGVLEVLGLQKDDTRAKLIGPLASAVNAVPVFVYDLVPGETAELPRLAGFDGPVGVILGAHGGVSGAGFDRSVALALAPPDRSERREHWRAALGDAAPDLDELAGAFRLSGGTIRRAAGAARANAALDGRSAVGACDVRAATRALNREALDALAVRLEPAGSWEDLAVAPDTRRDLRELDARCRHRERLAQLVGPAFGARLGPGVRALFTGPSGTGKTLAARLLASALGADLYRLDLSAVVSKYIGETEKNIHRALAAAEELDVMLLLDEGDALLGPRTGVQSSTDRYANLETNFLLQRLESFDGVLLITTNAADRIDGAFLRRMDVVVGFRAPDPSERWAIWQAHLPAGHAIDPELLREVSARCAFTGGQIRNAVLHAALLAATNGQTIRTEYLDEAVRREYRTSGGVCPLRRPAPVG